MRSERINRMTSLKRYPLSLRIAASVVLAASVAGCDDKTAMTSDGELLTQSNRPELIAPVKGGSDADTVTTMDDLSAQMAADAAFLDRLLNEGDRSGLATPPGGPGGPDQGRQVAAGSGVGAARPSLEIQWDGPNSAAGVTGRPDAATSALGTTEPEFTRSAIFTDPNAFHSAPISPGSGSQPSALSSSSSSSTAQPGATGPGGSESLKPNALNQMLVDMSRELYAESAYSDMPMRELLAIASQALIDPTRTLDPNALPDLTEREREVFGTLQTFFADLGKELRGDCDPEAVVVDAVSRLRDQLIVEPQLSIRTIALCSRVQSFGNYDELKSRTFLAQRDTRFGLYIEVENYVSELNKNNEWITELSREIIIYTDRDGIAVAKEDWQLAVDTAKHKRTDFYVAQLVELPPSLGVGKYHLKIRVRDEKSGAIAESAIDFTLVADEALIGK